MGLPANNTPWPPAPIRNVLDGINVWAAWYENNMATLTKIYGRSAEGMTRGQREGLINSFIRFFWNNTHTDLTKPAPRKIHVPIAADIAQASADLLFSEPPTVSANTPNDDDPDATTQQRLQLIAGPEFNQTIVGGAETSAALGGVYFRATWDTATTDHAFVTKVDADVAIPSFRYGKLVAVSFWRVVGTTNNGTGYYRHVEHHELDANGVGVIRHGLYLGTQDNIGNAIPFEEHEATRWLTSPAIVETLIDGNTISTLTPGLAVAYAPNITPSRAWRSDPIGTNLGRSDYDGIEPLMDALDEAWSSLMVDIRQGKGMLIVPESMVTHNGPGQGAGFEHSEIMTPVNAAPSSMDSSKLAIEKVQFDIRVEQHEQAIMLLFKQILQSAGYSSQTFGDSSDTALTATEVKARERRSYMTRDRKIRSMQPALEMVLTKCLAIDAAVLNSNAQALPVKVQFADGVQDDPEALARTAGLLHDSLSASIETRVRLVNPDLDDKGIKNEVNRILLENQLPPLEDPETLGANGDGVPSATAAG